METNSNVAIPKFLTKEYALRKKRIRKVVGIIGGIVLAILFWILY